MSRTLGDGWTGISRALFYSSGFFGGLVALLTLVSGCANKPSVFDPAVTGPFHQIGNYYLVDQKLPDDIRRVAMMPLTAVQTDYASVAAVESLQPVLYGELSKLRAFDITIIPRSKLQDLTGQSSWSPDDRLPNNFLYQITNTTACDAILFSRVTHYHAFPPMAIGWKMLMVNTKGDVLWSVDEVFDAGEARVVNSAHRYAMQNEMTAPEIEPHTGLVNSPRFFSQYAASEVVKTLLNKR